MSLDPAERETTITTSDFDSTVRIWTAQRRYIGRLRRSSKFTEIRSGAHDGTEWAEFEIDASQWNPVSGAKRDRAPMTDEQRAEAAARLAAARDGAR